MQKEKLVQDEDYVYLSEDLDVADVLQSREDLVKILTEEGIPSDEAVLKRLLAWKFNQH